MAYSHNYSPGGDVALLCFDCVDLLDLYEANNNNDRLTAFDPGQPG